MVGDRVIRYLTRGDDGGLPVVLVHGFGGDLNSWMFNHEPLAATRAVHALDGHEIASRVHDDGGDVDAELLSLCPRLGRGLQRVSE